MSDDRLIDVVLDEASLAPASANAEHERRIALFDLKESPVGHLWQHLLHQVRRRHLRPLRVA
jgi:uncharacterized protein (UPF0262 family)